MEMPAWFERFISPPIFESGQKTRRAEFLHYGSLVTFVAVLFISWITYTIGSQVARQAAWLLGFVALLQIPVHILNRLGYTNAASSILLTISWGTLTIIARTVDGIHDEAIFGYVLLLFMSGYLLGWRIALLTTLMTVAALWWLAYLEVNGAIVPVVDEPYQIAQYLSVFFVLMLLVVWVLIRTLTNALQSQQREIMERKQVQEKLTILASTDPLTGMANRRRFFEVAEQEFDRAVRYDHPLSLMILDLDLLKKINDAIGHLAGDQALVRTGDLLVETIRSTDTPARYGGDEFIVLLPETDLNGATDLAERFLKALEAMVIPTESGPLITTVSIGIAQRNAHQGGTTTLDQLITNADQALYQAKTEGRNRIVVHAAAGESPRSDPTG